MKSKTRFFIILLFTSFSLFNVANSETISGLNGKVKFQFPDHDNIIDCNSPKYRRDKDSAKIKVGMNPTLEELLAHMNLAFFSLKAEELFIKDDYKIIKEHIQTLLNNKESEADYVLLPRYKEEYILKSSIKNLYFNNEIIGEQCITAGCFNYKSFGTIDFSYDMFFVVDGAVVCMGMFYDNPNDTSIMEAYPKLFKKTPDGKYAWKNEAAREKFYKIFESDDENKPIIMKELKAVRDMILETLVIDE